jgi:hypothetical protein
MPDAAEQPVKRRPGRPRKNPLPVGGTAKVTPDSIAAEALAAATAAKPAATQATTKSGPADERIGQSVDDDRYTSIVFPDGAQYRIEAGVIAERVN